MHDLSPDGDLGPILSFVLMVFVFVFLALLLAKLVKEIRRLREEARAADRATERHMELAEGPGVVQGSVEFDDDAEYAVIMEIRQRGSERRRGKGGTTHHWVEVERRCFAQPFWIRHASGQRVRVEPGQDVELVDRLDITVHDEARKRFRIAELSEGEHVVARGTLELSLPGESKNYRETGPRMWLLVQGERARLHLSAERLGDHRRRVAKGYLKHLAFGWLPCALIVCAIYSSHIARMTIGEETTVAISSKQGRNPLSLSYESHGEQERERVSVDDPSAIHVGDELAFIDVEVWPQAGQIGSSSTFPFFAWLISFLFACCAGLVTLPPRDEWHAKKGFGESGKGKLPEPKPSTRKILSRGPTG